MKTNLCLSCRYAKWERRNGRLTGKGFCESPDPDLPALAAVKWWNISMPGKIRGGDINRATKFPVRKCDFYQEGGA